MLGWVAATGDFGIEAGTLFLIQFLAIPSFLGNWFLYEDYERQVFLCCQQAKKDKGYRFAGYFVYRMAYYSVITAFLGYTWRLFISCAVVIFLLGVWMLFYAVKLYKLRTAKAAKANAC
jgi:protoheme IX farnesyltransferase